MSGNHAQKFEIRIPFCVFHSVNPPRVLCAGVLKDHY
jgi:hypothetical protein